MLPALSPVSVPRSERGRWLIDPGTDLRMVLISEGVSTGSLDKQLGTSACTVILRDAQQPSSCFCLTTLGLLELNACSMHVLCHINIIDVLIHRPLCVSARVNDNRFETKRAPMGTSPGAGRLLLGPDILLRLRPTPKSFSCDSRSNLCQLERALSRDSRHSSAHCLPQII